MALVIQLSASSIFKLQEERQIHTSIRVQLDQTVNKPLLACLAHGLGG
jgi:hypothetical protein